MPYCSITIFFENTVSNDSFEISLTMCEHSFYSNALSTCSISSLVMVVVIKPKQVFSIYYSQFHVYSLLILLYFRINSFNVERFLFDLFLNGHSSG